MFRFILSNRNGISLPMIITCGALAGCLADTNPVVQVVPRVVLAPQNPRFSSPPSSYIPGNPPSGSMLVKWNRSIADTQLNFKGYLVKLYAVDSTVNVDLSTFTPIATAQVIRTGTLIPDTFYIFTQTTQGPITLHDYGIVVYGIKADSTGTLSSDSSTYFALFDPTPLKNPTNLRATSVSPNQVGLRWTPSPSELDSGFYRYVIYYRDTTKNDTGHIGALIYKPPKDTAGWNDSTALVPVPGVTLLNTSTTEWPYQFWIKAERNDSTFFYGTDTNSVTWAGAERVPINGSDTGSNAGYLAVKNGQSVFIGSVNGHWDVKVDSSDSYGQFTVSIPGDSSITLQAQSPDGVGFMSRMDIDSSLDSVYYSGPLDDPPQFSNPSITLFPSMATSGGVIIYLLMSDTKLTVPNEWARIFLHTQRWNDRSFINPTTGGIDLKASFQPAVDKDGSQHLPYY